MGRLDESVEVLGGCDRMSSCVPDSLAKDGDDGLSDWVMERVMPNTYPSGVVGKTMGIS